MARSAELLKHTWWGLRAEALRGRWGQAPHARWLGRVLVWCVAFDRAASPLTSAAPPIPSCALLSVMQGRAGALKWRPPSSGEASPGARAKATAHMQGAMASVGVAPRSPPALTAVLPLPDLPPPLPRWVDRLIMPNLVRARPLAQGPAWLTSMHA
jgi:hypothetical protein